MRKRSEQPEDTFADAAASARLTPMDVQQKEFGVTRVGGGYRMRDVDEFLDQLTNSMTALVEENRRLKEQAGSGAMIGAPDLEQVSRQADEIIRRAREEAAQIVSEAQRDVAVSAPAQPLASGGDASRAAISPFLLQEREFLQSLAGLVQGHAEAVKGMAREAQSAASAPPEGVAQIPEASPVATPEAVAPFVRAEAEPEPETEPEPEPAPASTPEPEAAAAFVRADAGVEPEREPERLETRPPDPDPDTEERPAAAGGPATQAMEEPVRVDEPEPATVGRPEPDEAREEGDRSLRDLFWGEE
jgi:DivIVA domain-containing protein